MNFKSHLVTQEVTSWQSIWIMEQTTLLIISLQNAQMQYGTNHVTHYLITECADAIEA